MNLRKLILAALFVFGSFIAVQAQLCGSFYVQLNIHEGMFHPVTAYSIEVIPVAIDELRGKKFEPVKGSPGTAQMSLLEGHVIQGKYRVIVSAPGYENSERVIQFPHCKRISYEIQMVKKGEARTRVSGQVVDQDGDVITNADITFTDQARNDYLTRPDFEGTYEIKLKPGDYSIRANAPGHKELKLEKFIVPTNGEAELELLFKADKVAARPLFPLKGTVHDEYEAVVPAVTVTATNERGRKFVTLTGDRGQFQRKLPVGKYTLLFERTGFRPTRVSSFDQVTAAEKPFSVRLEIRRCDDCNWADHVFGKRWDDFTRVQGTVFSVKGDGLPSATIRFFDATGKEVHVSTEPSGYYVISLPVYPEDTYKIKVESLGFQTYWIERYRFPTMEGGKITLDFVLEPVICESCH